jgi:hypothetical protein
VRGPTSFIRILETLRRHRVRFILVGGVAAVVEGAPVATFDVDIVPQRTPTNIRHLVTALTALKAHYRERPDRRLVPSPDSLAGEGHHLLATALGPLDVLGVIGRDRDFDALLSRSQRRKLGESFVLVLDLETQIAIKEELGRAKDLLALPVLRGTLAERRRHPR